MKAQYTVFILLLLALACTKPPDYPLEPVITFERMSSNSMLQGSLGSEDSISVTFSFTDGDGDIGAEVDTLFDAFVIDTRFPDVENTYKIPFVPLQGTGNGISGEVSLVVNTTCCLFPNNVLDPCTASTEFPIDTIQYEIFMKDRAGNVSNRILTDPIYLQCN